MNLTDFVEYIKVLALSVRIIDVIDVIIVSVLIYYTVKFIKDRRAAKLLVGLALLVVVYIFSTVLNMIMLNFILTNVFQVGIIALMIVFQPELRSALENMGSKSLAPINKIVEPKEARMIDNMIDVLTNAASDFSISKTGALIVIERTTKLGDIEKTGISLKAELSVPLLKTIFFDKTPLHDGAVIMSNNVIDSAGCILPLSNNTEQFKDLGTRHRAGLGMSEVCDAIVVIVSEETGIISIALNGSLQRGFSPATLESKIKGLLYENVNIKKQNKVNDDGGKKKRKPKKQ